MKFTTYILATITALATLTTCSDWSITNFVYRHAVDSNDTLAYFNARYNDGPTKRCYASVRGRDETSVANIPSGHCDDKKLSFGWSIKKRPNGSFNFFIGIPDIGGNYIIPASALTTFEAYRAFGSEPFTYQQVTPPRGAFKVHDGAT